MSDVKPHPAKGVDPPDIPHITNNIVPLLNVLKFHAHEAYKQLVTIIENLSTTVGHETDVERKKKFLASIISLRQDFVKLYTLVKWSQNSKDVSRLIDLLNWFRGQDFFFEQLGYGLNELNLFLGAKLPNSDILTSLEVLVKGRPQLPSYNFIEAKKISPEKTLEVLEDLNLILTSRMALTDDIPTRFHMYEIKNGRIFFTVPNEFRVAVTVANNLIVQLAEDYHKSPFFFIDFEFLFGINPDTNLITHKDNKTTTRLPKTLHANLERVANAVLLKLGLLGLYDTLHRYAISFKLYLVSKQLRDLAANTKWRNVIQYKSQPSLIIVNYWLSHYLSRNWKSFIELGVNKNYNIAFRWFKNGAYATEKANELLASINDTSNDEDLSMDLILNVIINNHSELIIAAIHAELEALLTESAVSLLNPHQISIGLTPTKSTIFAINPLTGYFYFIDPSPIQTKFTKIINSPPPNPKNRDFVTEADMIKQVVDSLILLKLETFDKEIGLRLATCQWISNDIIKLNEHETSMLPNFSEGSGFRKVQIYRCQNWPSSWFLINLVEGASDKCFWWVARIKSVKGEWKLQWVQELASSLDKLDFAFFNNLSTVCSNMIIDHMIVEELQARRIQYVKVNATETIEKFKLPCVKADDLIYESIIMLYNDGHLLPVRNSATSLFLKVSLSHASKMKLTLLGNYRNLPDNKSDFTRLNLTFNGDMFEIHDEIDLLTKINAEATNYLLDRVFISLNKLNQLIELLDQINEAQLEIVNNDINELVVKVHPKYKNFTLVLPEEELVAVTIAAAPDEDDIVKVVARFLSQQSASKTSLIGSVKYLKEFIPILDTIHNVRENLHQKNKSRLGNGILKLNFDVVMQNLNSIQLMFSINYAAVSGGKKVMKDHITFGLSFKQNKFDKLPKRWVQLLMKDNLNAKNLKYKRLFESIFKAMSEFESRTDNGKPVPMIKLNYDYLLEAAEVNTLMIKVSECIMTYLNEN